MVAYDVIHCKNAVCLFMVYVIAVSLSDSYCQFDFNLVFSSSNHCCVSRGSSYMYHVPSGTELVTRFCGVCDGCYSGIRRV